MQHAQILMHLLMKMKLFKFTKIHIFHFGMEMACLLCFQLSFMTLKSFRTAKRVNTPSFVDVLLIHSSNVSVRAVKQ